jgi:hypothetical protein
MKLKEKWAKDACKQIAVKMLNTNFHDYHDNHYEMGWLAGLEFAKKELMRMYKDAAIDGHLAAGLVERLGEFEE